MSHTATHCLNCGASVSGKFCANCGQKSATHRITTSHFLAHDVLHGVWHIDKGIPFTLKEIFLRPGRSAEDYIAGKRVKYYNVFYLLLLLLGLNILAVHYHRPAETDLALRTSGDGVAFMEFLSKNVKYIIISFIPILAFNGWILFRRKKYNYAEHVVFAGFAMLTMVAAILIVNVLGLLPSSLFVTIVDGIIATVVFVTPAVAWFFVVRKLYSIGGFSWRILTFYLLFFIEFILVVAAVISLSKGGKLDGFDGQINFS